MIWQDKGAHSICRQSEPGLRTTGHHGAPVAMPDCTAGLRCLGVVPMDHTSVPPCLGVSACTLTADNARSTAPSALTHCLVNPIACVL
ncbi:MAG: hypothetical protein Ct9H300mP13_4830 [Gammaproteobacteria bacterium]|nr:MAG: hypothetical protein Ct9H300mP13_4830 [Gammaproteobacteria bacterium]